MYLHIEEQTEIDRFIKRYLLRDYINEMSL